MAMGFTTPNYFSVLFKKYTSMTPTEYLHRAEGHE
jgi:YesN/AraC family two-component response regulator